MKEEETNLEQNTHRRGFLGMLASGAAALGLTALTAPLQVNAQEKKGGTKPQPAMPRNEADVWFDKVKGRHRVVYDATEPNEIFAFAWPKVFIITNAATGTPATDCGVVVVLRHAAIGYAFQDAMWEKYDFGDMFKANEVGPAFKAADAATATKTRNPFWNTKPGDFQIPGSGSVDIGIKDLMKDGVMFCVCNAAMTVYSAAAAG